MLMIRLQRVGRKNIPTFRIVVTDKRNSTKSGKYLEVLGNFDPVKDVKEVKEDRVKYWMSMGAKPTDTLHNFFIEKKIISGKKVNALPKKKPIKPAPTEASGKEEAKKETAPAEGVAPVAAATEAKTPETKPEAEAPKETATAVEVGK